MSVTAGIGSEERGFGSIRYGANLGDTASYRVYGKCFNRSELVDISSRGAKDAQQLERGGGRIEWQPTDRDDLTLEGDFYRSKLHENPTAVSSANPLSPSANRPGEFSGGHLMGRWTRASSKTSNTALQVYYDNFRRKLFELADHIDTFDLDFQHHAALGERQDIVWGFGYRLIAHKADKNSSSPIQFNPQVKTVHLFSGFAQNEITLVKERLRLILGVKLEHNYFSGLEAQPSVRLSWTPSRRQTVWAAGSRAVRTISQSELLDTILRVLGKIEGTATRQSTLQDPHFTKPPGSPLNILVAEDNDINQKVALSLLEKQGHTVALAANGIEAIFLWETGSFDLVFMDVKMPQMDGLMATAVIRDKELSTGKRTPIIAMTAHAMKGDRERCLAAGMDDYVPKPIQARVLYEVVS